MATQLNSGEQHNAALEYYNSTAPLGRNPAKSISREDFLKALETLKDYTIRAGYSPEEANRAIEQYNMFLDENNFFYRYEDQETLNEVKLTDYSFLLDNALKNNSISQDLFDSITKAGEMIFYEEKDEDSKAILSFVKELRNGNFPESDQPYLEAFVSVYESSYEYWNGNPQFRMVSQNDGVIIMDAVGALHGLLLGPVVSIVEGAVCSIAKNHGWWAWL